MPSSPPAAAVAAAAVPRAAVRCCPQPRRLRPPTLTPNTISGTTVEYVSNAPLSGFTVTVGQVPDAGTCLATQAASANACGVPAGMTVKTTTSSSGTFSVTAPATGTYMLTIGKDATYATLHRTVSVAAGANAIGTVKIAALSTDEQNWLVDVNTQRATAAVPASFANLQVDEYAEEQARKWSADVVAGTTTFGDAGYAPYQAAYGADPGAIYGAAGVLGLGGAPSQYVLIDNEAMAEKSNCPSGNWQTCTFASNTGHLHQHGEYKHGLDWARRIDHVVQLPRFRKPVGVQLHADRERLFRRPRVESTVARRLLILISSERMGGRRRRRSMQSRFAPASLRCASSMGCSHPGRFHG